MRGVEHVDAPKSRRSRRVIDLDQATKDLLAAHREHQAAVLHTVGRVSPEGDRVFTNDLDEALRPDSVGQAFTRLLSCLPLPMIRLHDLRHTHASHLVAAGLNAKVVSERLGHASVSFSLDTYGHVMPGQQAAAAATAAALLGPVGQVEPRGP